MGRSKTKGIKSGNDTYLNKIKEAARENNREQINKIKQETYAKFEKGEITRDRWNKVKAWVKLAKDGRLLTPPILFGLCLDAFTCWCINNPIECGELPICQ